MAEISGLLVTVRTGKQGAEMMRGKMTLEYLEEISSLKINPDDMAELPLSSGQKAKITSPYGETIVSCHASDVPKKLFFLPLGPVANRLVSGADTDGTGVPAWKGQQVSIEPAEQI
ncbi:MAG: molybdopterin dinucleotide binding domain-containing protein [Desulfobacteraceae bacterium]|jgi:formylmethanofuran dehydrogenase subunit D